MNLHFPLLWLRRKAKQSKAKQKADFTLAQCNPSQRLDPLLSITNLLSLFCSRALPILSYHCLPTDRPTDLLLPPPSSLHSHLAPTREPSALVLHTPCKIVTFAIFFFTPHFSPFPLPTCHLPFLTLHYVMLEPYY